LHNNRIAFWSKEENKITIKRCAIPECGEDEILLRILYAGICGTDIQLYTHQRAGDPTVLGHECLAKIVKVGKQVKNFFIDEMVSLNPNDPLDEGRKIGHIHEMPGVFQDYYLVKRDLIEKQQVIKLGGVFGKEAVLLEPFSCIINSQERVKEFITGKNVLILGAGFMGQLHALTAKVNGADNIFLANRSESKLDDAINRGIIQKENAIPMDRNFQKKLEQKTSGKGVDLVIVIVSMGQGLSAATKAIDYVIDGGAIYLFGGFREEDTCVIQSDMKIPFGEIRVRGEKKIYEVNRKAITFAGSRGSALSHWEKAISMVGTGKILIDKLITHTIKLEQLPDTMEQLGKGYKLDGEICIKAVIDMGS
jgi:threonine dehydrogenase-like Zn-dependent dehydrogenase